MLLFIALANSHYFLRGDSYLLFGYGVAHIVRRNERLGRRPLRRLLWRRSLVLVVVGFLHAVLLYLGDIHRNTAYCCSR